MGHACRPSVHARRAGGIRAVARTPIKVTAVSGGEVPLNLTTWCLEQVCALLSHTPSPAYTYVL